MSNLDHLLLYSFIVLFAILYDYIYRHSLKHTYNTNKFFLEIILFILTILFVCTEGLRYGRGVDQLGSYGPLYLQCMNNNNAYALDSDSQFLFVWINKAVYYLDFTRDSLPFGSIFIVYALIFWFCLWRFYKDFRSESKCFLLFAILATNYITEWTIRQGVSFSFILLAFTCLDKKKWKSLALCLVVSVFIHVGNVFTIFVLGICYLFVKKTPITWRITIPLFIILEYTVQAANINGFMQNLITSTGLNVSGDEHFSGYLNSDYTDREVDFASDWKRGAFQQLITVAFYSALIFVGYFVPRTKGNVIYIYNAFVIGIMLFEPFRLGGTFARFFLGASVLWFVPLSVSLYYKNSIVKYKTWYNIALYIIICYLVMYYGRYIFLNPDANYVWNL